MKFTKRMLSMILALALALGLAMPTMAAVNWHEFMFTKRAQDVTIKLGDSFTLSVEVSVPEGAEAAYQWYYFPGHEVLIENATTSELHLGPEDPYYPPAERLGGTSARYLCRITAYEKDQDGNPISSEYLSNAAYVKTERTALGKLYDLTIAPFTYAFDSSVAVISMTYGILLPVVPVVFLVGLIYGFFEGLSGLLS